MSQVVDAGRTVTVREDRTGELRWLLDGPGVMTLQQRFIIYELVIDVFCPVQEEWRDVPAVFKPEGK